MKLVSRIRVHLVLVYCQVRGQWPYQNITMITASTRVSSVLMFETNYRCRFKYLYGMGVILCHFKENTTIQLQQKFLDASIDNSFLNEYLLRPRLQGLWFSLMLQPGLQFDTNGYQSTTLCQSTTNFQYLFHHHQLTIFLKQNLNKCFLKPLLSCKKSLHLVHQ